ncbi:MAG: hypothetical protein WBC51_08350 [Vicinamibacterales bacterium]
MTVWTYAADGSRTLFDFEPSTIRGCCLCGDRRVEHVGLFVPATDEMHAIILKLRQHPARPNSTPCVAYGLCGRCGDRADRFDRVEAALATAAARVVVQ